MDQNIKIFTTQDGQAQLEVALEQETVWLIPEYFEEVL